MHAPSFLPSFLRWFLNWFFFSLLDEGDDFTQILRKVAATVLVVCLPVPFGFASYYTYQAASGAPKYGPQVVAALGFLSGMMVIVNYLYLRSRRHMSDLNADIVFLWLSLIWLILYLCVPDLDPRTTCGAIAIVAALAQPPRLTPILAVLLALSVLSIYIQDSEATLPVIAGAIRPSPRSNEDIIFPLVAMTLFGAALRTVQKAQRQGLGLRATAQLFLHGDQGC